MQTPEALVEALEEAERLAEKARLKRHHRHRVIKRRQAILRRYAIPGSTLMKPLVEGGRLNKYNLSCSCPICKLEKHKGREKPQYWEYDDEY